MELALVLKGYRVCDIIRTRTLDIHTYAYIYACLCVCAHIRVYTSMKRKIPPSDVNYERSRLQVERDVDSGEGIWNVTGNEKCEPLPDTIFIALFLFIMRDSAFPRTGINFFFISILFI